MTDPFRPPQRRPTTEQALLKVVHRYAVYRRTTPERIRRWIGFMAIGAALERARAAGGAPFLLKGGVTLELRLHLRARATKDLDVAFRGTWEEVQGQLAAAFVEPSLGFTMRIAGVQEGAMMRRFDVRVEFDGRGWAKIPLEVSIDDWSVLPPEQVHAFDLTPLGLEGPGTLACIPLVQQVAQKLHAVTRPTTAEWVNERVRDLVDLQLLAPDAPPSGALREACEATFRVRATHRWPPQVAIPAEWPEQYRVLAEGQGLEGEVDATAAWLREYIAAIAGA